MSDDNFGKLIESKMVDGYENLMLQLVTGGSPDSQRGSWFFARHESNRFWPSKAKRVIALLRTSDGISGGFHRLIFRFPMAAPIKAYLSSHTLRHRLPQLAFPPLSNQ